MIELVTIRILSEPPGIAYRYLLEARFIDKAQGYHDSEIGAILNYDKTFSITGNYMRSLIRRAEANIAEILQS